MPDETTPVAAPPRPRSSPALESLVARTSGLQPWRRVLHASSGLSIATGIHFLGATQRAWLLGLLAAATATALAIDAVRLTSVRANELFFRAFGKLASPREARGMASSTWYALGGLLTALLFPPAVAVSAVLVLGLGDPVAAFVGRSFGKRPFLGGTLEGTLAFFAVCTLVVGLRHSWPVALAAAAVSTLVERRSWPLDDNLAIPVACGAMILATEWMLTTIS